MSITKTRATKPRPAPLFVGQSSQGPVDDFVSDVLALVRQHAPEVTAEQAAEVDAALRERWGGDRPYIAKRHGEGRSDRNAAIRRDFQRGESIPFLMRRYSLSRVTIWRVLGVDMTSA